MELIFAMPLVFKESLATGDHGERNAYAAWKNRFGGKTVFLIGWSDSAFAVVDQLGDYHCENISGHPSFLFETPNVFSPATMRTRSEPCGISGRNPQPEVLDDNDVS